MTHTDQSRALLVVGHGTRSAEGVGQFTAFIDRLSRRADAPYPAVSGGFIELSDPPVTESVGALVDAGHRQLAAVPLVLVAAGHGKGDIPAALLREQVRHPGMTYRYGRPLGPHPTLLRILERRVDEALGGAADRADVHVLLVGRGSSDPDANAEVAKVARLFWEGRGFAGVEPSFISLAEPSVPAGLERLRRLGAERIVVAPYFLFAGVLPERIVEQTLRYAAEHPELVIACAEVMGDTDELAELVVERYHETLAGDIRMNCDTCMYRVALPGFDHRVGQPQRPHHHPADGAHDHGEHDHDEHDHAHGDHGHPHSPDHVAVGQ
ncbi:sirohydrochlorin chelatase [uncultured Jatrophihabitans sp.]|uniref:sirohydrochlorin chelatase n=1 Tax=uncultured Jatrophihabitans sp. TaxID=1610747 RepID=UPI0035CA9A50